MTPLTTDQQISHVGGIASPPCRANSYNNAAPGARNPHRQPPSRAPASGAVGIPASGNGPRHQHSVAFLQSRSDTREVTVLRTHSNQTSTAVRETTAAFTIDMQPAAPHLEMTDRYDFTKLWTGGMSGASSGLMLSAGDPARGKAGYVALERFDGTIDGLRGSAVLQQYGSMNDGLTQYYEFVPGSGTDGLTGVTGTIDLAVTEGDHRVHVHYALN